MSHTDMRLTLLRNLSIFTVIAVFTGGTLWLQAKPADPAPKVVLPVVAKAPAWRLTGLDGREITAASFKGKVVVVDFWATWCGPCIAEIPGYVELQKQYGKDGLVIVGASVDQKGPAWVKQFAEKNKMDYTLGMADEEAVAAFGGFDAIPTTFLIDREGNIRHRKTGTMERSEYEKLVQSLL